jgi:nucleotide-binding universal stress UspA family protein
MLTEIKTILYATDLSPETESALSMSVSLAEKYRAEVICLNVVEPINPSLYAWGEMDSWSDIEKSTHHRSQITLEQQVNDFFDKGLPSDISVSRPSVKVITGNVAKSILLCADDINADLIVMGSNSHSAISELLLGSVADKVMRLSKRPVLLVPAPSS